MAGEIPPTVTPSVAAKRLQRSESSIRKDCVAGKIPFIKTPGGHYRIPERWVDREVEKQIKLLSSVSDNKADTGDDNNSLIVLTNKTSDPKLKDENT